MKPFLNKAASAAAGGAVILAGCAMAGLGLTVIALLAMFALAAFGLSYLVAPLLPYAMQKPEEANGDPEPTIISQ